MNSNDFEHATYIVRGLLAALVTGTALVAAQPAAAHWRTSGLVAVDVVDRTAGTTLAVHVKEGERFVVGAPGHEYAVRIRNNSAERILAVTSVDGVNVVTGETGSPDQSGYVIGAGDSVEIIGWRRSLERTAAFYFTDLGDSYAARTERPANVGVIGIAVFRERPPAVVYQPPRDKIAAADATRRERGELPAAPVTKQQADASRHAAEAGAADVESPTRASRLGTGFGRPETSPAQRVRFERASATPGEMVAIRYDRRENLIAMGVLPAPRHAQREPDPFPGMRFAPPPR